MNLKRYLWNLHPPLPKVQHSLDFGDYNQIRLENFSIPIEEMYPIDSQAKERRVLERNVYHDYSFAMISGTLRSTSERLFERSCEQNPKR